VQELSHKAQCIIRAAQVALEERKGRMMPGVARAYLRSLPDGYKLEARAAVDYTVQYGKLPPIIVQVLSRRVA
jgi:hypothetical protein